MSGYDEDMAEQQRRQAGPGMGASMGRTIEQQQQRDQARDRVVMQASDNGRGERAPKIMTCKTCACFVPELAKCTVGQLTSPIDGQVYGGNPRRPREWQMAAELRSADPRLSSCGPHGAQWEPIF